MNFVTFSHQCKKATVSKYYKSDNFDKLIMYGIIYTNLIPTVKATTSILKMLDFE